MKICFFCDLHLPQEKNVLQHDVWNWAMEDILAKKPDCAAFAGDVTCDGNAEVYFDFIEKMQQLPMPFLYIPGNSDLRSPADRAAIETAASPCKNNVNGTKIFALNDCTAAVSDEQLAAIELADENSVVFMHHPFRSLAQPSREKMQQWRKTHPHTYLFFGHLHESAVCGTDVSLQALDPDKASGECPCLTYFDTDTAEITKSFYDSPVPEDFHRYFGVSCYDPLTQVDLCTENKLKYLELRPGCINADREELAGRIAKWRQSGGQHLCIHLPDVDYKDGTPHTDGIDQCIELANLLNAQRFTQHVPKVSVKTVQEDPSALEKISAYLAEKFNAVDHDIVIGVENMHMTAAEKPDETRRFGYIPEECLAFMRVLGEKCRHKVGINFDIGHARNNAPFSQRYQTSSWLSLVGPYTVGYHIHQVTQTDGKFNNHMPVTHVYGKLISYASFFKYWSSGKINKAPLIFEMRPEGAYETTLRTFGSLVDKQ